MEKGETRTFAVQNRKIINEKKHYLLVIKVNEVFR